MRSVPGRQIAAHPGQRTSCTWPQRSSLTDPACTKSPDEVRRITAGTAAVAVAGVAERLRKRIADHTFGATEDTLTVSIGVASTP